MWHWDGCNHPNATLGKPDRSWTRHGTRAERPLGPECRAGTSRGCEISCPAGTSPGCEIVLGCEVTYPRGLLSPGLAFRTYRHKLRERSSISAPTRAEIDEGSSWAIPRHADPPDSR